MSLSHKGRRAKGARGELEAAALLRRLWPLADRRPMQSRGAARDGCEVEGTPWWVEVKCGARPPILAALRQALRDLVANEDERAPLVMAKTDRQGWTVTLRYEDFANLVIEARQARAIAVQMAIEAQNKPAELAMVRAGWAHASVSPRDQEDEE